MSKNDKVFRAFPELDACLLWWRPMTTDRMLRALAGCVCSLTLTGLFANPVYASPDDPPAKAPASAGSAAQNEPEDARVLQLAEPEYRVVNVPTTMLLPKGGWSFDLTHRFNGNLANYDSFVDALEDLFGIDQGAVIGIEVRYGILPGLHAAFYRTSFDKTIQFHGKYDAIRQASGSPVNVSALVSVEGTDNFKEDYAPALGASVSRTVKDVAALYAAPMWVHNTSPLSEETRDTFMLGLGARVRLTPSVYVSGEVTPRLSGYQPSHPEFAFAIEKRVGGHMFQLNFTNTSATTYAQVARGGFPDSLYMGFNLARKFF
jgi:hypothetical protein